MFKNMLKLFELALQRFTNPFFMLTLAFVVCATQRINFLHYPDKDFFANFWALVTTAAIGIYVYYLGPRETVMKRWANVFVLFVSLAVATAFKWMQYLPLISADMVSTELARSVAYVVNSSIGIIIGQ